MKDKKEEIKVEAKGFFFLSLHFTNNKKPRIKEFIKKYKGR